MTSEGADLLAANSAPAPDDKKNEVPISPPSPTTGFLGETNGHHPPAGKPTPNNASARKPADGRINHPAIRMVKEITGRYPPKHQWDRIIREILNPDTEFFKASYEIWGGFGGNLTKIDGWLYEPNERKMLPQRFEKTNGHSPPTNGKPPVPTADPPDEFESDEVEPLTAETRQNLLVILRGMLRDKTIGQLQTMAGIYTPEDWQWLMNELKS